MSGRVSFEDWTGQRSVRHWGTNSGADRLPFQAWRHLKEAFTPELVARAIRESARPVTRCLDPFGGSGTTALACQFLGVFPTTIEVNPYLADLIQAKVDHYDVDQLARDLRAVLRFTKCSNVQIEDTWDSLPPSFIEPIGGGDGSWLFDRTVATQIARILTGIDRTTEPRNRLLLSVLLGGVLVDCSNVVVSGKGRRYRQNWRARRQPPEIVASRFTQSVQAAIKDIHVFGDRAERGYRLLLGDSRRLIYDVGDVDIAVFSPPYPNSFDYTDVYNVELWILRYLTSSRDNQTLRRDTFTSHVQISRSFGDSPTTSATLDQTLRQLRDRQDSLWSPWIPAMIGGYFADMRLMLAALRDTVAPGGSIWMVVGDSRYAGVGVLSSRIVAELAQEFGFWVRPAESLRAMRTSAQQGGDWHLSESLIVLDVPFVTR